MKCNKVFQLAKNDAVTIIKYLNQKLIVHVWIFRIDNDASFVNIQIIFVLTERNL